MYCEDLSAEDVGVRMAELMESTRFARDALYRRLGLAGKDVMNVFVVGSRLWGTASYESDWDFVVVHKRWKKCRSSEHNGDVDASVIDQKEYRKRVLKDHKFFELSTLWLPETHVWQGSLQLQREFQAGFNPSTLRASVDEEALRDWRVAEKMWLKGKTHKAKKIVVHTLTMATLAARIARNRRLEPVDYSAGYVYYREIMGMEACAGRSGWDDIHAAFFPRFEEAMGDLAVACSPG